MRICGAIAIMAFGMGSTCQSVAGPAADIQVVTCTCDPAGRTAEGPPGADLTKRQSRFYRDSAIITSFTDYKGHLLV